MAGPSLALLLGVPGYLLLYGGVRDVILVAFFSLARQRHFIVDCGILDVVFSRTALGTVLSTVVALSGLRIIRLVWASLDTPRWDGPGKILLFPCRTTHSRVFPKKHSFSYSYLVVGVPVGWEGCAGGMVSAGITKEIGFSSRLSVWKGWYDIDAGDYLERGNARLGLRGKLDEYLKSQGADPTQYPYAYLVTAPRFLGYHFNPVSFWYLYDANKSLAGIVLEVNNTFDERHMYYLTPKDADSQGQLEGVSALGSGNTDAGASSRTILKQTWPKEFHVSPFSSRKGSYSISASDPLSPGMQGMGPVNNTITLISSKSHGKLVARLLPEGAALDPYTMTSYQKLRFLASWWWVGLATFPRIVKEAGLLYFRRQLHVWFRPEPLKNSIGRNADATETQLELLFRRYLRHLVEQSTSPLVVKYSPSGIPGPAGELMLSPAARDGPATADELEFKVLTPAFYTRFVHYAHDLEAFFCEFQDNCTIWISRPDLLAKFVFKKPAPPLESSNLIDYAYFKAIQKLRARPERIEQPLTSSSTTKAAPAAVDIRDFRISSMDSYVLTCESARAKRVYRSRVLKLFLADRIALGSVPLLEAQRFILQALFAWAIARADFRLLTPWSLSSSRMLS